MYVEEHFMQTSCEDLWQHMTPCEERKLNMPTTR